MSVICLFFTGFALLGYERVWGENWKSNGANPDVGELYCDTENLTRPTEKIVRVWEKCVYSEKGSDCKKALEINPRYAIAYGTLGQVYSRKGQYDLAISNFDKCLALDPTFIEVYYERAVAYCRKGNFDKSWEDLRKAKELGFRIPEEFLNELKKASRREK